MTLGKILLIGLPAAVVLFLIIVAMQPADFQVVRETSIAAPPTAVFANVNDFHKWEAWSPWGKIDPAMKQSYEGPAAGPGAGYYWNGNSQVGEGRMTVTDSKPAEFVRIKLDFMRPFAGSNDVEFSFKPDGNKTAVTWMMKGKKAFIPKAIGIFISMDKMIGPQFEQGLTQLKNVAETKM